MQFALFVLILLYQCSASYSGVASYYLAAAPRGEEPGGGGRSVALNTFMVLVAQLPRGIGFAIRSVLRYKLQLFGFVT
jgi:hypothetical protein